METFFQKELNIHSSNSQMKYLASFGLGTANSMKQEYDNKWLDFIGEKLFNPNYSKIFYLIDCKYCEYISEYKPTLLNKILNHYYKYDNNYNNFTKYYCNKIKTLICDKCSITIHILPFNLNSSYKYDEFIINPESIRQLSLCFQSEPKTLIWKSIFELFRFYTHNPESKLYINNNILTNTRYPFRKNNSINYVGITIGLKCEYTSEIIYILKKMLCYNYKFNIYFKNYIDYSSGYFINEISKLNGFKNLI